MPVSVRLDDTLEARLRKIAEAEGISVSEVLRRAAVRYCEEVAGNNLDIRLADIVGIVHSAGRPTRRSNRTAGRRARKRS